LGLVSVLKQTDVIVMTTRYGLSKLDAKCVSMKRLLICLIALMYIFLWINPIFAETSDNGMLVMQIIKPDCKPSGPFSVECFYYDKPTNRRNGDSFSTAPVPNDAQISIELKGDSVFFIEPSKKITVRDIGSITKWDVNPRKTGDYILILSYSIKGEGTYKLPSKPIKL
jgi:hypothetical protein